MFKKIAKKFYRNECDTYSPDVLILVDHIGREMEFAKSLLSALRLQDISVEIITTKFNLYRIPYLYRAYVVVTPWVYTDREAEIFYSVKNPKGNGTALVVNLHCEQIAGDASDAFLLPRGKAIDCYHISWSKLFSDKLMACGVKSSKILEYGNPKLDEYKKPSSDNKEKVVLIAGNAFHLLTDSERSRFASNGVNISGIGDSGKKNYEELILVLDDIVSHYKDFIFVYRPHPSFMARELKNSHLKNLTEKYNNFKIDLNKSISHYMIKSVLVLSFHSTSYLEAVASNTPFAVIRFEDVHPSDELHDLIDWPYIIRHKSDLIKLMNLGLDLKDDLLKEEKYKSIRDKYFICGESVTDRMSTFVEYMVKKIDSRSKYTSPLKVKFVHNVLFIIKLLTNLMSFRFPGVRRMMLSFGDYRIQNLVYMWGNDSFDKRYLR